MNYATVMVHLELEHANDARLQVAGDLAERFGAKLIGIAACDGSAPLYYADSAFAESLLEKSEAETRKRIAEAEERFRSTLGGRGVRLEWRSALTAPTDYVAHEARVADVVITGPNLDAVLPDPFRRLNPNDLVMQAGRPVMVVPPDIKRLSLGQILVAWKDTREAQRAIWDALPLLKAATDVTVVEVVEGENSASAATRVDDVAAWLGRHGVSAAGIAPPARHVVAEELDLIAGDLGATLIVAGAYGHARLREWVFGGVTSDLLIAGRRCSFLSH